MTNLGQIVRALLERDGVAAVLLVSGEGLPIEHAVRGGALDADAVAALTATVTREAGRLGEAAGLGESATAVMEFDRGLVIQVRVGAGDWLVVLGEPGADVGELLYVLRRHRMALGALL
jgi:predicted regulator of Ras-like GTPase activity (Roadblock/LC7/MglB family)